MKDVQDLIAEFFSQPECEHHEEMRKLQAAMFTHQNPLSIQSAMKAVLCEWVEMKMGGNYTLICNDKIIQIHLDNIWYRNIAWGNAHLLLELLNESN